MPSPTALGRTSPERFKPVSRNCKAFSAPDNRSNQTKVNGCFQSAENVVDYCTQGRKTCPASIESNHSATVGRKITITHLMSAKIFKLRGAEFCLAQAIGGLLVERDDDVQMPMFRIEAH